MSQIFLSVIIPSFDEMANLQKGVLDKVKAFLDSKKYGYEVIIVDDGSRDGSREFVEKFVKLHKNFSLIKNNHSGKAGAVTAGVLAARGKYRLFTDMDQATPIEEVDKLLPFFEKGYDVVIGSRGAVRKGSPLTRRVISKATVILRSIVLGLSEISDTQCGFKMFSEKAATVLFSKLRDLHHGFSQISGSSVTAGFDMELLYLAKQKGLKIQEVPVEWLYVETRRVNPIKDSIEGLLALLEIRLNKMQGKY